MINETSQVGVLCDIPTGGLMCFNMDQPSGQCLDYEIRVFCEPKGQDCSGTPSLVTTVAVPTTTCGNHWSPWINEGAPGIPNDSGMSGDKEVTANEYKTKMGFCSSGTITRIECETPDGQPSDMVGDIMDCSIEAGLECLDDINGSPCHDYQIRYFCEEICGKCFAKYFQDLLCPSLELQCILSRWF